MRFGSLLRNVLAPNRSVDNLTLSERVGRAGVFVAQKTILDYCEVKTGRDWADCLRDPHFTDALTRCRWLTLFVAQGDLAASLLAWLRRDLPGADPSALALDLARVSAEARTQDRPPEAFLEASRAADEAVPRRLQQEAQRSAIPVHEIVLEAGPVILANLPIHPALRQGDEPAILGGMRFNQLAALAEIERALPAGAFARAMQASAA